MYFAAVIIIACLTAFFLLFASGAENETNIQFLKECGWSVENKCIETAEITIPDPFDLVYESYNNMQIRSGFDLSPYKGRKGIRYTYRVVNYPLKMNEEIRANVICIDGNPVGGDICTVSANGFMHGLREFLD